MSFKLLSVVLVVVSMAALGIGGTLAYFSDVETSTGNTFQAGTVDISLQPGDIFLETMKPSQIGYTDFTVTNAGNNPVAVWKLVKGVTDSGGANPEPEQVEEARIRGVGIGDATFMPIDNISTKIIYDLSVTNPSGGTPLLLIEDYGLSGVFDSDQRGVDQSLASRKGKWIFLGVLPDGESMLVTQSYHLATDATNVYQGDVTTFDVEFWAGQVEGAATNPVGGALPTSLPPGYQMLP